MVKSDGSDCETAYLKITSIPNGTSGTNGTNGNFRPAHSSTGLSVALHSCIFLESYPKRKNPHIDKRTYAAAHRQHSAVSDRREGVWPPGPALFSRFQPAPGAGCQMAHG